MAGKTLVQPWRPWVTVADGQIGGWTMEWAAAPAASPREHSGATKTSPVVGQLVFATVRGAGHQVPTFQPVRAQELFRRFLADEPL